MAYLLDTHVLSETVKGLAPLIFGCFRRFLSVRLRGSTVRFA